jgi:hypothetical protein
MPLSPKLVQGVFLQAADHHSPGARAAILNRECSAGLELRWCFEVLMRAHVEFMGFLNEPVVGADGRAEPWLA